MKPPRLAIACVVVASLAACASAPHPQAASTGVVLPAAASAGMAASASVAPAATASVIAPAAMAVEPAGTASQAAPTSAAVAATGNDAVDDFDAIYGTPAAGDAKGGAPATSGSYDPWQKYNRRMHAFNNGVDKYIARPLAKAYVAVLPQPVRNRVSDFFDNLSSPVTLVNQVLQGHVGDAWKTLGRFVLNSTVGIGGLFDPATRVKIAHKHEDFGQTLAVWGWRKSRYFELPFFGPRTLRDTFGLVGDIPLSPTHYVQDSNVRYGLEGLELVDTRAQLLSMDSMREGASDDYALIRDAWMQHRDYQIQRDLHRKKSDKPQPDDSLPDYLRDQPDDQDDHSRPDVPANALPVPAAEHAIPIPVH